MKTPRPTVAVLMGLVLLAAVGLAALRASSPLWASGLFTMAVLAILGSAVVAVASTGIGRATASGFAIACGGYLAVAFGPLAIPHGTPPPPLLASPLLALTERFTQGPEPGMVEEVFVGSGKDPDMLVYPSDREPVFDETPDSQQPSIRVYSRNQVARQHHRIGHTLVALALGACGALLGRAVAFRQGLRREGSSI